MGIQTRDSFIMIYFNSSSTSSTEVDSIKQPDSQSDTRSAVMVNQKDMHSNLDTINDSLNHAITLYQGYQASYPSTNTTLLLDTTIDHIDESPIHFNVEPSFPNPGLLYSKLLSKRESLLSKSALKNDQKVRILMDRRTMITCLKT